MNMNWVVVFSNCGFPPNEETHPSLSNGMIDNGLASVDRIEFGTAGLTWPIFSRAQLAATERKIKERNNAIAWKFFVASFFLKWNVSITWCTDFPLTSHWALSTNHIKPIHTARRASDLEKVYRFRHSLDLRDLSMMHKEISRAPPCVDNRYIQELQSQSQPKSDSQSHCDVTSSKAWTSNVHPKCHEISQGLHQPEIWNNIK